MSGWSIELEPEVEEWLQSLAPREFGTAAADDREGGAGTGEEGDAALHR